MQSRRMMLFLMFVLMFQTGSAITVYGEESSDAGNNDIQLETITVTAQKREEDLQAVPISMDVMSNIEIEASGIESTVDLVKFSPNVHMKKKYAEHVPVIRGISSFGGSQYPPSGFYVDDISYSLLHMQNVELVDVERIEILKGPQGTLYGRNSESGVINVITRQPSDQFEAKIFAEYGDYNSLRSGVNISGPILEDKLSLGGAFQYKYSDGYVENESNGDDKAADVNHINGRGNLRWTPSDVLEISLISDFMDSDDHIGGNRYTEGPQATEAHKVRKDTDEYYEATGSGQNLRARYHGSAFDVLSVSSVINYDLDRVQDNDMYDNPANNKISRFMIDERQYSQELRISSPGKGAFEWLCGLYGFMEETSFDLRYDANGTTAMHPVTDIDAQGMAFFSQGAYTFFEKLQLTAGIRFDHQEMEALLDDAARGVTIAEEVNYDEILPKFSISYNVFENAMFYSTASKGYLVGGFNWATNAVEETFTYDPEYTWNYEIGLKSNWLEGRLMANLSAFYIDIEDKQVTEYDVDTFTRTVSNAAEAHSQGVELQLKARLARGFEMFAGVGYNEVKFDNFTATEWNDTKTAFIEKDYTGNYLPYAPLYTYNLGMQYRSLNGIFARVDYLGTDKFYGDNDNKARQNSYETLNLKVGYEKEKFDIYLWAKNVLDEEYLTYLVKVGENTAGLDGDPMTFGFTVNYRF